MNNTRPWDLDEICVSNPPQPPLTTHPSSPALYLAATYACHDPAQANRILGGDEAGYAYQRDAHPNAQRLADKYRQLHQADFAWVTNSGMAALSAILLSQLNRGDHVLLSRYLYGRSSVLVQQELPKFGIESTEFDPLDLAALPSLIRPGQTKLMLVETIANPLLQVADLPALVDVAKPFGVQIAVDNTFATPYLCRPLTWGVDWVWESVSKMLNGHSDLMLGMVCGRAATWGRLPQVGSTWGLASAPWDCFLAERGLMTFGVRMERACQNAAHLAQALAEHPLVRHVYYPGLPTHSTHRQLHRVATSPVPSVAGVVAAGNLVSFELDLEHLSVERWIAASGIPYFPSLGECSTTVSHPASSSHRHLTDVQRAGLGLGPGTLRLSVGIETAAGLCQRVLAGLQS